MPRKKRKPETTDSDSATLQEIIGAMMKAMGRGGLTYVARTVGMTPSALKKRVEVSQDAWDEPTLRAALLVLSSKVENIPGESKPISVKTIGDYDIIIYDADGTPTPFWRKN